MDSLLRLTVQANGLQNDLQRTMIILSKYLDLRKLVQQEEAQDE